ncbi:glycosyl transferase [Helicobacter cinaedi]|nr:glycosyl transferase [Helicobacter cinaedi]
MYSCIIFSHSPTPPKQVEYIHFVDSDDMLSVDCIEQCIENIGECDIIWHDTKYIYEDGISPSPYEQSILEWLKLDSKAIEKPLNASEIWANIEGFSCVCVGVFHISLCEKLRFAPQIQSEDALFGMLLFAKAKAIKILPNPLYIYRLRADSTSDHTLKQDSTLKPYPPYLAEIAYTFANSYKIKHYHFAYSCTYICLGLLAYIESLDDSQLALKNKLIEFLQVRAIYAFGAVSFESDPKYVRPLLKPLEPYMQKVSKANKIAYFMPRIFKILKWINGKRKRVRIGKIQNSQILP